MTQDSEALDLSVMEQLLALDDGGTELLEEMCQLFVEDTPGRIRGIEEAIRAGKSAEMADMAHAVKGAASTMGAPRVRNVAAILEAAGRGKGPEGCDLPARHRELEAAYLEAVAALEAHIATLRKA